MRLLTKSEISEKKSAERKLEVDEGAKLARKIDLLRETASIEEIKLSKFRDESLSQTRKEIDNLIAKKLILGNEVLALIEDKKRLQLPLDREWEKVRKIEDRLTLFAQELNEKHLELQQRESDHEAKTFYLLKSQESLKDLKRDQEKSLKLASLNLLNLKEAERVKSQVDQESSLLRQKWANKDRELTRREAKIAVRERETQIQDENLKSLATELVNKERQIGDKYSTLQRTINRLKK